jgi:hypothetical protein
MLEFYSSRYLRVCRFWRPSQVQRLLGKPDAIIAEDWVRSRRRPRPGYTQEQLERLLVVYTVQRRVYLKARVEAVEQSRAFRSDQCRLVRSMRNWTSFRAATLNVIEATNALYWCGEDPDFAAADRLSHAEIIEKFEAVQRANTGLEPLYRLDGSLCYRCSNCGKVTQTSQHEGAPKCFRVRTPPRIESTTTGFKVINTHGEEVAHLFHADWALPLAMAIAGKRLTPIDGEASSVAR